MREFLDQEEHIEGCLSLNQLEVFLRSFLQFLRLLAHTVAPTFHVLARQTASLFESRYTLLLPSPSSPSNHAGRQPRMAFGQPDWILLELGQSQYHVVGFGILLGSSKFAFLPSLVVMQIFCCTSAHGAHRDRNIETRPSGDILDVGQKISAHLQGNGIDWLSGVSAYSVLAVIKSI